jgi:hypothetical protein
MPETSAESSPTGALSQLAGWELDVATKPGLYANIHAKQARIAAGSGEKMRKPGTPGAPTAKAFKESAKTAKPANKGK